MDLKSLFFDALLSPPKLSSSRNPEEFLGRLILPTGTFSSAPLHIISGGSITASFPWTFDIGGLDCFILLYTKTGGGKLQVGDNTHFLLPSSLLLLNCNQHFRMDITVDPWEYQVYFIGGSLLSYYSELLPSDNLTLIPVSSYSDMQITIEQLPTSPSSNTLLQELLISDLLHHIITSCLRTSLQEAKPKQISPYIKSIKELFDEEYQEPYSLDELEERFGISKYRLCREFSSAYDMSPLQYLNKRRIQVAAYLLQTTGYRVHEVGSLVGIDNTNHFIHLFKKFLDCTPSEYKQRTAK